MVRDLTVGKSGRVIFSFCLPLFLSVVFQQLYTIADSFVAGRFIGENALASVGNSYEMTLIFLAFAVGCSMGSSVLVSRLFGAKEYKRLKSAVTTSIIATVVCFAFLMLIGLLLGRKILLLINTPDSLMEPSWLYLEIYLYGLPFLFLYNLSTGIFSGLGDSRTPFIFLALSSTANILMDIYFVAILDMGVAGVAWATFICQGISCVLALVVVAKRLNEVEGKEKAPLFSLPLLKDFLSIAVPTTLQQSFVSIGNILIQSTINSFGPGVMAGYAGGIKLNNLVITSFTTIGNGISNFTAQNQGAGKTDRIKEGEKAGIKMVWTLTVPIFILYFFFSPTLLKLFLENPSKEALESGKALLSILSPFYFVVAIKLVTDGVLKGLGRMKEFMIDTFSDLILRVALSFILSATALGSTGIWLSWPIGWSTGTVLSLYFYSRCTKEFGKKRESLED
ncbi:MAG: MATE family efflux transporter [Candidatus Ornithospirochaeta sp.]